MPSNIEPNAMPATLIFIGLGAVSKTKQRGTTERISALGKWVMISRA